MGGSETSLRKKIRPIVENFYGRLYSYSLLFDKFYKLNDSLNFKKIIRKNFKYKVNVLLLDSYLKNNLIFLRKLKVLNFWESNFFFLQNISIKYLKKLLLFLLFLCTSLFYQ